MPMRILKSGREDASDSAVKMAMESLARMKTAQFDQPIADPGLGQPTPKSTATPSQIIPATEQETQAPMERDHHGRPVEQGTSATPEQVESFIAANPEAARAIFAKHPELAGKVTPQHPM